MSASPGWPGSRRRGSAGRLLHRMPEPAAAARYAAAAAFVAVLAAVTSGAAVDRNTHRLATNYGNGPTVSIAEEQAFAWLADRVRPEERVVNYVADGGVWMYALAGVRPFSWTFYGARPGTDAQFLLDNLNRLDTDPRVRAVLATSNAPYVWWGRGTCDRGLDRGEMIDLADVTGLREVYRNPGAVVYEVREEVAEPDARRAQSPRGRPPGQRRPEAVSSSPGCLAPRRSRWGGTGRATRGAATRCSRRGGQRRCPHSGQHDVFPPPALLRPGAVDGTRDTEVGRFLLQAAGVGHHEPGPGEQRDERQVPALGRSTKRRSSNRPRRPCRSIRSRSGAPAKYRIGVRSPTRRSSSRTSRNFSGAAAARSGAGWRRRTPRGDRRRWRRRPPAASRRSPCSPRRRRRRRGHLQVLHLAGRRGEVDVGQARRDPPVDLLGEGVEQVAGAHAGFQVGDPGAQSAAQQRPVRAVNVSPWTMTSR